MAISGPMESLSAKKMPMVSHHPPPLGSHIRLHQSPRHCTTQWQSRRATNYVEKTLWSTVTTCFTTSPHTTNGRIEFKFPTDELQAKSIHIFYHMMTFLWPQSTKWSQHYTLSNNAPNKLLLWDLQNYFHCHTVLILANLDATWTPWFLPFHFHHCDCDWHTFSSSLLPPFHSLLLALSLSLSLILFYSMPYVQAVPVVSMLY